MGILDLLFALCVTVFLVLQAFRKSKLTKVGWFGLILLDITTFVCGCCLCFVIQDVETLSNCSYKVNAITAVDTFITFNLTAYAGYRVYILCYDMAEFAALGSLPTVNQLKLRKTIFFTAHAFAAIA